MLTIDAELLFEDNWPLIIEADTGIKYTVQAGGIGCTHPECEGFAIAIGAMIGVPDDCSYGCQYIPDDPEAVFKLSRDIDNYLKEYTKDWSFHLSFNYNKLIFLQEGWWPVKIRGIIPSCESAGNVDWAGYLSPGNCD